MKALAEPYDTIPDDVDRVDALGNPPVTIPDGAAARSQSSRRMAAVKASILGVDDAEPEQGGRAP